MNYLGFVVFLIAALVYIWNGKDSFNKKQWIAFFVKFLAVIVGSFVLVLLLTGLRKVFPSITKDTGRQILILFPLSFATILFSKFFVVMLCTIFDIIMRFHKHYNTAENYSKLSLLIRKYGPKMRILAKGLASFGCILIFYGIWLTTTV
ncbi:hypothetical protein [Pseudescherichia vulneris]|uniref:hypothetical protein n=1 Tax=Pseudescherichia vulneris TaxID=566 RepID=UPI0030180E21